MIKSSSANGAFDSIVLLNSGSVSHPSPSSLVPDSFWKWPSVALILSNLLANSFSNFLESSRICSFSFSVTSCHSELFAINMIRLKGL